MSKQNGYIGRSPGDSAVIIASQTFEPTGIQTDFTFASGYTVGYLDVYFNGARLIYADDYTASDGSTVGLTTYANNGDVIECVAYKAFNVGDVSAAKNNFTVGSAITMTGATGTISATSFSGDGSGLTGVGTANVSTSDLFVVGVSTLSDTVSLPDNKSITLGGDDDLEIHHAGGGNSYIKNNTGELEIRSDTTKIFNKSTSQTIAGFTQGSSVGITTVGILTAYDTTQSTSASTGALVIHGGVGIAKSLFVDGNVTIGGTLTYEDMTNTDNLGFGTFRKGIEVQGAGSTTTTLNVTGVSTFSGDIRVPDDKKLQFGNIGGANGDLQLWHDAGQHSYIRDQGSGDLRIYGSAVDIRDNAGTASVARFTDNSVHLAGITTVGILTAYESITVGVGATLHASSGNAVFAGIVTATTLKYGSTSVETAIDAKASTGKAIAMAMVFGF